jgi:multisubunit Na+/H+ antiporter MnhG subunit
MNKMLRGQEPLDYLVKLILIALLAVLTRPFSLPILVGVYVLSGVVMWTKDKIFAHLPEELHHPPAQK